MPRTCSFCGATFIVDARHPHQHTCNHKCHRALQVQNHRNAIEARYGKPLCQVVGELYSSGFSIPRIKQELSLGYEIVRSSLNESGIPLRKPTRKPKAPKPVKVKPPKAIKPSPARPFRRNRKKTRVYVERPCCVCGTPMRVPRDWASAKRHCSYQCASVTRLNKWRETRPESSLERLTRLALTELGIEFEQEYTGFKPYAIDFFVSPNIALECDGAFWHSLPANKRRDARKDAYLSRKGITVIRLLECEIKAPDLAETLQRRIASARSATPTQP